MVAVVVGVGVEGGGISDEVGVDVGLGVGAEVEGGVSGEVCVGLVVGIPVRVCAGTLADAGRNATVAVTTVEVRGVTVHRTPGVAPGPFGEAVARATWEFSRSLTEATSLAGDAIDPVAVHDSLPSPSTSSAPPVVVVSSGDRLSGKVPFASTGNEVSTPENAEVTIDAWVAGEIFADTEVSPGFTTETQPAKRVELPRVIWTGGISLEPPMQRIVVNT